MKVAFKPGDRVCWKGIRDPTHNHIPGTILKVIPKGAGAAFALYEVEFEFGTFTLYGTQLESVREAYR